MDSVTGASPRMFTAKKQTQRLPSLVDMSAGAFPKHAGCEPLGFHPSRSKRQRKKLKSPQVVDEFRNMFSEIPSFWVKYSDT